jgi:adenylyl-sulfate kinase
LAHVSEVHGSIYKVAATRPLEHAGFTVWFTGMSGAGKTTVSHLLAEHLRAQGAKVELLDGDVIRTGLSRGLGFSREDREENIRRIGFVCELLSRNGVIAIVATISPYRSMREEVRARVRKFVEVYVQCPLEVLVSRDVKGLYKKAVAGEIPEFTGVSAPYEAPVDAEVTLHTAQESPDQGLARIWTALENLHLVANGRAPR